MALLDDIKLTIRMSSGSSPLDGEVIDLINAAKSDMILCGVSNTKIIETDPLIKRAITTYCKANFGWNNPDAERLQASYELLRNHLSMSIEYNGGDVNAV